MRALTVALFGGLLGGAVVAVYHDLRSAPSPEVAVPEVQADFQRDIRRIHDEVAELSVTIAGLRGAPEPARTEVDPRPALEFDALSVRVGELEKLVDALAVQVKAQGATTTAVPVSTESLSGWPTDRDLKQRYETTDRTNANALVDLGDWASARGLETDAKRIFRMAVKVDPDHALARNRLGYQQYEGKWLTAREIERVKAKGN